MFWRYFLAVRIIFAKCWLACWVAPTKRDPEFALVGRRIEAPDKICSFARLENL